MLPKRYWAKVLKGPEGKCWIWTGAIADDGYGRYYLHDGPGGMVRPHRYLYQVVTGQPLSDDTELLHQCDVTICVNPDHLSAGSKSDNMSDRSDKRRSNHAGLRGLSREGAELRARALRDIVLANGWDDEAIAAILAGAGKDQPRLF